MKKMLVFMAIMLVATVCLADQTSRGNYTTPITPLTSWLNNNNSFLHDHSYTDNQFDLDNSLGLGADIKVYDFKEIPNARAFALDSIDVEYKYDFNNEVHSVYGVLNLDLIGAVRNLF